MTQTMAVGSVDLIETTSAVKTARIAAASEQTNYKPSILRRKIFTRVLQD